jgi:hypothetical protein
VLAAARFSPNGNVSIVRTSWLIILGGVLLVGCESLTKRPAGEPSSLPIPKPTLDSVGLEVAFLRLTPDEEKQIAPMWDDIDESHLPTEVRRRLAANGIVCGLIGGQMPAALRELISQSTASSDAKGIQIGSTQLHTCRHLQSRHGQRSELLASEVNPTMTVLTADEGHVSGKTYRDAQCIWAVKTFTQSDGRVRIELVPEVHHGQPQNEWIGQASGVFQQVTARPRHVFEDLRVETDLAAGQTLVLSSAPTGQGLGKHFFTFSTQADTPGRKLLLIRLAGMQQNGLFSPDPLLAPIVQ